MVASLLYFTWLFALYELSNEPQKFIAYSVPSSAAEYRPGPVRLDRLIPFFTGKMAFLRTACPFFPLPSLVFAPSFF